MDAGFLLLPDLSARSGGVGSHASDRPHVRMRRLAVRDRVFTAGSPVDEVYELVQGAVLVFSSLPDGRRQIVDVVTPGRLFGLTAAAHHRCSAVVVTSSLVCALDLAVARRNERIAERIGREMLDEIDRLRALTILLGRKTALERVASFFVGSSGGGAVEATIDLPVTRCEIADHLGLTVETVCRAISTLRRMGVVDGAGGHRFRIPRPEQLARLADGDRRAEAPSTAPSPPPDDAPKPLTR